MNDSLRLNQASDLIRGMIGPPFEWCSIDAGGVRLNDASQEGGTKGGEYRVMDFWMAKYPVTNDQYQAFIEDQDGFENAQWWEFSLQARQWHRDHSHLKPTAFYSDFLPRTRVSWFDSMAFCNWLSAKLRQQDLITSAWIVRLPTEQEWQRAAVDDTDWLYPWGNEIDLRLSNYGKHIGQPTPVDQYDEGKSPYGVMDMIGNVWEWCLTAWGEEFVDLSGYSYRAMRGGAWNVSNLAYLRATGRYGHPPRGQLNDAGFRIAYGENYRNGSLNK